MSEPPPGTSEQLVRLVGLSVKLLRRAWAPAAALWVLGTVGGIVVVAASVKLFVAFYPEQPGLVGHLAATVGIPLTAAAAIALVLAGPLAVFSLALGEERVGVRAALHRALVRLPRVFGLVLFGTIMPAIPAVFVSLAGPLDSPDVIALLSMFAFASSILLTVFTLVPYVALVGFLGVASVMRDDLREPALGHAYQLSFAHPVLTLVAFGAAWVPAIATSTSAFATDLTLARPSLVASVAPIAGIAVSLVAFGLLAVAANAVASGEGGEDS